MDSKYNKIKKGLGSENTAVPPEFSWENMQDGIYKKMDDMKKPSSNKKTNFVRIAIVILLLLLIQFVCSPLPFQKSKQIKEDGQQKDKIIANEAQFEPNTSDTYTDSQNTLEQTSEASEKEKSINTAVINKNMLQSNYQNKDAYRHSTKSMSGSSQTMENNKVRFKANILSQEEKKEDLHSSLIEAESSSNSDQNYINDQMAELQTDNTTYKQNVSLSALQSIDPITRALLNSSVESTIPEMDGVYEDIEIKTKENLFNNNRISLMGGASFWTMAYGDIKPERDAYETAISSFNTSLSYFQKLSKSLELMIGLQYTKLESRFDFEQNIENYTVTISDTLIQIQNNLISGNQTFVRGDVEVPVDARRIVKHYNSTSLIQMPIALGLSLSNASWSYGIYAGALVNIYSSNSGRTYFNDSVFDYQDSQTDFMSNRWKFNALVAGRISYSLNDRIALSTGIQFQKSMMNWSLEENVKMRPSVYSLSLGCTYKL